MTPSNPSAKRTPGFPLSADGDTIFGSAPDCDRVLPAHPRLAARHLLIRATPTGARLRDLGAGTVVNGRWIIGRWADLRPGDEIDVGPLALRYTGLQLESVATMSQVALTAKDLSHTVIERGKPKPLLQDISLALWPGEFTCILGPSGCGKSTLVAALSGRLRPNGPASKILLNHRNLYDQFELVKQSLVLVPQRTVVHGELTVQEVMNYTARLRLPSSADRAARIDELLDQMDLNHLRATRVKRLSGGEEKRLCLANELISDPSLVFLDEVTSGLDDATDEDLMSRFKLLANAGKTLVCITHSLAHVMETCTLVVVLAPGGRLVFVGPPDAALRHFSISALSRVYELFGERKSQPAEPGRGRTTREQRVAQEREKAEREVTAQQYAEKFLRSREYVEYVTNRMPGDAPPPVRGGGSVVRELAAEAKVAARQSAICTLRSLRTFRRDWPGLGSLLLQTLLVAAALILAFGQFGDFPPKPDLKGAKAEIYAGQKDYVHRADLKRMDYIRNMLNITFLLGVTCFWFGCNNAAKELVRERAITTQERMFNLRPFAVFSSKLLILTVVSCLQGTALLVIVWGYCKPPGEMWSFLPILLALAFVGTTLGLAISALAPSEGVAVALIPIAVVPQIILSSAIVTLTGPARLIGELFVTNYWGKRGLDALVQGEPGDFARGESVNLIDANGVAFPLIAMGIHAVVFCVLTLAGLAANGSFRDALGKMLAWAGRTLNTRPARPT